MTAVPERPDRPCLRRALRAGEVVVTPALMGGQPWIVELFGALGFTWAMLDTEHSDVAPEGRRLHDMVRAADTGGMTVTVRVAAPEPRLIGKALDAGAQGVWISHVETAEQARAAVDAARYAPLGHRGAAPIVRSARHGVDDWDEYVARANDETSIIAIVETVRGVQNAASIAAVPGLDAVQFGQFDFGVDAGLSRDQHYTGPSTLEIHPLIEEAAGRVLRACDDAGIAAGSVAWSPAVANAWVSRGFRLVLWDNDVNLLRVAAGELLTQFRTVGGAP